MAKQTINIGASPNDGTGTPLRTSFDYTNQNFTELYTALGGGVGLPGATTQVIFNDGGTNLAGDAGLVYNKTTDTLTAGNATITGAATVGTTLGVTGQLSTANVLKTTGNPSLGVAGATEAFVAHNTGYGAILYGQGTTYDAALLDRNTGLRLSVTTSGAQVSGDLTVSTGNVVMATSGKGIDFGVTTPDGSGTVTDELLDDYEEGTWVPTDLSGAGLVFTVANCKYTKIGRAVTVQGKITYPATVSAANAIITGFPFAAADAIFLSIAYTDTSIAAVTYMDCNSTAAYLKTPTANTPNSAMSGKNISFLGTYYV